MMFLINLVFQCQIFDTKLKKLRYLLSELKYWLKNPGRSVSTNYTQLILILVDPVDDEDVEEIVHELILQTSDNVRSKEMQEY